MSPCVDWGHVRAGWGTRCICPNPTFNVIVKSKSSLVPDYVVEYYRTDDEFPKSKEPISVDICDSVVIYRNKKYKLKERRWHGH